MSNQVRYTPATAGREKTAGLWANSLEAYESDPSIGQYKFEDFEVYRANTTDASAVLDWFIQDATAGGTVENFTSIAGVDGLITLSADTGTDWFGIEAHRGGTSTTLATIVLPSHSTLARGDVVVEYYIKIDDCDHWFLGLSEPIVEFLGATGALPTNSDYIGFFREDGGIVYFVSANDNAGGTGVVNKIAILTAAQATTLQAAGYFKIGFRANRDLGVSVFVENVSKHVEIATFDTDGLPIETLTHKIALLRGATGDNTTVAATVDWVAEFIGAK